MLLLKIQELHKLTEKYEEPTNHNSQLQHHTIEYIIEELSRLNKKLAKEIRDFANEVTIKRSTGSKLRVKEKWKLKRTKYQDNRFFLTQIIR